MVCEIGNALLNYNKIIILEKAQVEFKSDDRVFNVAKWNIYASSSKNHRLNLVVPDYVSWHKNCFVFYDCEDSNVTKKLSDSPHPITHFLHSYSLYSYQSKTSKTKFPAVIGIFINSLNISMKQFDSIRQK